MSGKPPMQLDQLIAKAVVDPSYETELFTRLLEADLFVHAPKKPTGPRLSVVQFTTPQGVLAIPVFTDRGKSEFAARGNVRTVPIQGRRLFYATLGATMVIDPNDNWCILYPEEIRAILQGKKLCRTPERIEASKDLRLKPSTKPAPEFLEAVIASLSSNEQAIDAWLTEADVEEGSAPSRLVIVVAAEKPHHERIARTLTLSLSDFGKSLGMIVDVTFIEPGDAHEAWLKGNTDCLIYRRAWLPGIKSGLFGNA